jgi:hypothetical protein
MNNPCQSETRLSDELRLIPRWSIVCAIVAFILVEYYFWIVLPVYHHAPSRLPYPLHVYLVLSWGALAALSMLVIGYISNDAPRRGMSARLWMICVVIPGGVGPALYFLLRQPILASCPACGSHIESGYHYCPQCAYQVSASCGNCYRSVRITDIYCAHCGHELAADHPPARLHAFGVQARG